MLITFQNILAYQPSSCMQHVEWKRRIWKIQYAW